MNKKQIRVLSILIISILIGLFSLKMRYETSIDFSDSFNEFNTPSELTIELEKGEYTFYELTTNSSIKSDLNIDYLITEKNQNPKIIEIGVGSKKEISSTKKYTLQDKHFKSIGKVLIDEKQSVKIISIIRDERIDKLAYRIESDKSSIFDVMKYSLLLLISGIGVLISIIIFLMSRNKG